MVVNMRLDLRKVFLAIAIFFFCFFLAAYYAASILTFKDTNAATDVAVVVNGSGYYINATSASEGTVQLDVASTPSGALALAKDSINVKSNAPDGYKIYVAMARDDNCTAGCNSLYKDKGTANEASIPATAGTFDHPETIGSNSWGFAIDQSSIGAPENSFSIGYNTAVPDPNTLWAAMPLKGQDQLIQTVDQPNADEGIDAEIYFGVKTNTAVTPGIYGGTIVYTIVGATTGEDSELVDVAPSTVYNLGGGERMTITTAYTMTPEQAGAVDVTIGGRACTDVALSQGVDNNLVINCTAPALAAGKHSVVVSIPSYSKEVTLANAVEYVVDTANPNVLQNVATWDAPAAGATISKLSYPAGYYDAGTYDVDLGGASAANVLSGTTFSSNTSGINQVGTMPNYQAQYSTSKTAAQNTADAGLTWNSDNSVLSIAAGYHIAQTISSQSGSSAFNLSQSPMALHSGDVNKAITLNLSKKPTLVIFYFHWSSYSVSQVYHFPNGDITNAPERISLSSYSNPSYGKSWGYINSVSASSIKFNATGASGSTGYIAVY